ncbi:MAG: hypothetical protein PVG07_09585 [Acidobacteriota bacterium]
MPRASAPGKVILMGEHAAVYGRTALVAAAGLRLTATLVPDPAAAPSLVGAPAGRTVRLAVAAAPAGAPRAEAVPELRETTTWEEILRATRRARTAWERYAAAPSPESFRALGSAAGERGPAHLLHLALGEAAEAVDQADRADRADPADRADRDPLDPARLDPIALEIRSEIPIGSGFGSSAAAAVAVVMAYLASRGVAPDPERVHRISLEVERRQHGTPSGVDNATVIHGGVLAARRVDPEGSEAAGIASGISSRIPSQIKTEPVAARAGRLSRFRVASSGPPAEGTGTVVAAVRALRDRRPRATEALFDRLAELTAALRRELCAGDDRPDEVAALVREAEARLEELGVVPEPVRRLVRAIEARGGAAKISGAGSLAGPGAGNLLLYHPDPAALAEILERAPDPAALPLTVHDVELGAPGARLEDVP